MTISFNEISNSTSWPCVEAKKIYHDINGQVPAKGYVLFETGYGPSGLPHIGTFAEVVRTVMVKKAFEKLCDIPTKLICFSDDMDALRKVPENIPNQLVVSKHIGKPLTDVIDPYGEQKSFGHYMNAKLRSFLDQFGFEYEFYSATECYKSGMFDYMMIKTIEKYDDIMQLMLPTFRAQRRQNYSPFMPICPETGILLQVQIETIDASNHSISYRNQLGQLVVVPVTGGHCKLQWKPDFGMRWSVFDVNYEMYGKDHQPSAQLYNGVCKILGGKPPVQFFYELFLDQEGSKISKSKGNSISIEKWIRYAPIESMILFIFHSPTKAKRLHFDVLPKSVDEYIAFNKKYHSEQNLQKKIENPVYHIHHGCVPLIETYGISFSLLLNLASVCNTADKSVLWGFISKYAPQATPKNAQYLDHMMNYVLNYYNDFIKDKKKYLVPSEIHKTFLKQILDMLKSLSGHETGEEIQNKLYIIGKKTDYLQLNSFFKDIYQILLGEKQGPRLGSFFKLYGILDTIKLIEQKIN